MSFHHQVPAPSREDTLRSQLSELQQANAELMNTCENEGRDLNEREVQEFDANSARFTELETQLSRVQVFGRQRELMTMPQPRLSPVRQPWPQNGPTGRRLGASIINHPDFKAWHMAGGYRHRRDLSFEISAASTWPTEGDMGILAPGVGGGPSWLDSGIVRGLIPKTMSSGPAVTVVRETGEDMLASYQSDYSQPKKESTVALEATTMPVTTIAHFAKIPDQLVQDLIGFETFIEQRLRLGLIRKEESELLAGTGATSNFGSLQGILTLASEVVPPAGSPNSADIVLSALVAVQAAGFTPDAVLCSPSFWASVAGMKGTTGTYLIPALPSASAPMSLWGVRTYVSSAMTGLADFLVGDFANGSRLFIAQNATIQIAYANDDFTRNQQTIRCELREAHCVFNAAAYSKQTGSGTKATPVQPQHKK